MEYQNHAESKNDPLGLKGDFRALRGGSFKYNYVNSRCAVRYGLAPEYFNDEHGFRVCIPPIDFNNT